MLGNFLRFSQKVSAHAFLTALESVLKPSKSPKVETGKADNGVEIKSFLFISGGKAAVVFQF